MLGESEQSGYVYLHIANVFLRHLSTYKSHKDKGTMEIVGRTRGLG